MIHVIDTCHQIKGLFDNGAFNFPRWEAYINSIYNNSAHIFKDEADEYINSGLYTFEKDFLPVINAVYENPKLKLLRESFSAVTDHLNQRITEKFGKCVTTDIVLYLGLCNAAGKVTRINGIDTILLGIEKILELNWYNLDSMYGLIYHELGHMYHSQHGILEQESNDNKKNFVWQLFTEGTAMYFEQALIGDFHYYHQDVNGWREWCDAHFTQILLDFDRELPVMTRLEQRYFGDWCNYYGYSDTGYYLGSRFVQYLTGIYRFDDIINLKIDAVYDLYREFVTIRGDI